MALSASAFEDAHLVQAERHLLGQAQRQRGAGGEVAGGESRGKIGREKASQITRRLEQVRLRLRVG